MHLHSLKGTLAALFVAAAIIAPSTNAKANLVITFSQVGPDVVANGVGSLDFSDLGFSNFDLGNNRVDASTGLVLLGTVPPIYTDGYSGNISGPTTFGAGGNFDATSGSSTAPNTTGAGINGAAQELFVPAGYAAGDPFTVSSTWAGTTISGLGLTPGTYVWNWGSSNPDSLTVIIPGAVVGAGVPEPSGLILVPMAAACLLAYRSRRRVA